MAFSNTSSILLMTIDIISRFSKASATSSYRVSARSIWTRNRASRRNTNAVKATPHVRDLIEWTLGPSLGKRSARRASSAVRLTRPKREASGFLFRATMKKSATSAYGNTTCRRVNTGFRERNSPQPHKATPYGEIHPRADADRRYGIALRQDELNLRGVAESRFNDSTPSTYTIIRPRGRQVLRESGGEKYCVNEDNCIGGRIKAWVRDRSEEKKKQSPHRTPCYQVLPSCRKNASAVTTDLAPLHPITQTTQDCSPGETFASAKARSLETRITSSAGKKRQGRKVRRTVNVEATPNRENIGFGELDYGFAGTCSKNREEGAGGAGDEVSRYARDNANDKPHTTKSFGGHTWIVCDVDVREISGDSRRSRSKKVGVDEHVPPNRSAVLFTRAEEPPNITVVSLAQAGVPHSGSLIPLTQAEVPHNGSAVLLPQSEVPPKRSAAPFSQAKAPAHSQSTSGQEAHKYVPQTEDQRQQASLSEGGRLSSASSDTFKLPVMVGENLTHESNPMSAMFKIDTIFGSRDVVPLSEKRVSGHGRFQGLVLACAHLATAVMSFYDMSVRLLAANVDHWCKPPPGADVNEWKSANIPLERNGGYSRCFKYEDTVVSTAFRPMFPRNASREIVPCTEWQYDLAQGVHTVVTEWDLVCHNAWQVHLITIYYNLGYCVMAPLLGQMSDRHGRKKVITASLLIALISSATGTTTSNFFVFLLARIFLGVSVSMLHINIVVLLFEATSPEYRSLYFLAAHFGYVEGSAAVTLLESSSLDHRVVGVLGLVPTCILSLSACVVFESPRWLLATLNMEEFYRVEKRLAEARSVIDVTPDPNEGTHTTEGLLQWKKKSTTDPSEQSVFTLFSNRAVRHRTACVWGLWFLSWLSMYGLWNIASRPLSFRLALVAVIPRLTVGMLAYAIVKHCTRKGALRTLLPASLATALAACQFATFLQDLSLFAHQLPLTLAFAVDAIVELHTLELCPTVMRAMGLCMALVFGRLGVTLFIALKSLAAYTHACGGLVFVVGSTVCIGLLMKWMQETKDAKLAESVYDVEIDDMKHAILKIIERGHRRR